MNIDVFSVFYGVLQIEYIFYKIFIYFLIHHGMMVDGEYITLNALLCNVFYGYKIDYFPIKM